MLTYDQRAVNGLLLARRMVHQWQSEEWRSTRPALAARLLFESRRSVAMFNRIDATPAFTREAMTHATFVGAVWSPDAIAQRDRRDFEQSLRAQAERLKRQSDLRRGDAR